MTESPIRVLFVCTGNSARSIMAEALLRQQGGAAFEVYSAGTVPRGVNPLTIRTLEAAGIDASWARSKSVTEYLGQRFDYVITVCDQARQSCPVFPGVHESLHWGYEDPAEAEGTEEERLEVFRRVFIALGQRIGMNIAIRSPSSMNTRGRRRAAPPRSPRPRPDPRSPSGATRGRRGRPGSSGAPGRTR